MNILCQLLRSLPPHVRIWRSRGEIPPIEQQKLHPQLQGVLQAISYNPLVSLAFVPPQQRVFQEMTILYKSYTRVQQFLSYTLEDFPVIGSMKRVVSQPIQLDSTSWLLTSFFNQFSIAFWILSASLMPIRFCAECIASEKHTTSDYRYLRAEGV
jgi:hypothetical protein